MGYVNNNGSTDSYNPEQRPKYPLEHLATFKVGKESGILKPVDGMKRLVKLGESTGIWPHKMMISFEPDWIIITDYESGNIIEGFPGNLIQEPTAFTSTDPSEIYNNILVFIVGASLSQNDMHIFQSTAISAIQLVADLESITGGNKVPRQHSLSTSPISKAPSTNLMRDQYGLKEMNAITTENKENFEFDIQILNHCLEDIEKFVTRLHYTVGASNELQSRQQIRSTNGGDTYGEGLLRMRSQRPVETEFLDIFAKFKLAFNYIAKLKKGIKEPRLPIHHLFTSLELIIDISHDYCDEKNLPEQVIDPLLMLETIELLKKVLTPQEKRVWHSCGDPWNIPRELWQGKIGIYRPVFSDGWCPDIYQEDDNSSLMSAPVTLRNGSDTESVMTYIADSNIWLKRLEDKNAKVYKVAYDRRSNNDRELNVQKGEYLEILDDSRKWWKARNSQGQVGYVPHTILVQHIYAQRPIKYEPVEDILRPTSRELELQAEEIKRRASKTRSISMPNPNPPPPPPLPPSEPVTPYSTLKKSTAIVAVAQINNADKDKKKFEPENRNNTQDDINHELALVLALKRNREDINITHLPDVYIDEKSTPKEVAEWLKAKEFSKSVINSLDGVNGKALFDIPLRRLVESYGPKIGRRLDGMIIIQKKHCRFQTAGKSELKAILARARQKNGETEDDDEEF